MTHGKLHFDEILPAIESRLFDDGWRLRQSSVYLLGDLLYLIGGTKAVGISGGMDEDDAQGNAKVAEAIRKALGAERRASILASLYMIRCDVNMGVRQGALQVWKTIVPNTPRTLREVMPVLTSQIITALASSSEDMRTIASRALGDIVRKLGDSVLNDMVPFLQRGLGSGDENMREGVCLGLAEMIGCATKEQVEDNIPKLLPAVREALCDESGEVRRHAAAAFQKLYRVVGSSTAHLVLPALLADLDAQFDPALGAENNRSLVGLREIVQLRPYELLPALVPKLLARPVTVAHATALREVAGVTGGVIHLQLRLIVPALVSEIQARSVAERESPPELEALQQCAQAVVSAVETSGIQQLVDELLQQVASDDTGRRQWGAWLCEQFFAASSADFKMFVPVFLKELLQCFTDSNEPVLLAAVKALKALGQAVPVEEQVDHIEFIRNCIGSMASDARHRKGASQEGPFLLPGLNVPKGLEPLLPVYQHALMHGTPHVREVAATGLGELVALTSAASLRPFLIKLTGPLIRIVGDRSPSGVKAAILMTLSLLLEKGGVALKSFVPQLQTTFVKALSDPVDIVRERGSSALELLMPLSTRVDPLVNELISGAAPGELPSESVPVQVTMLETLGHVLASAAAAKISPAVALQASTAMCDLLRSPQTAVHDAAIAALKHALQSAHMAEDAQTGFRSCVEDALGDMSGDVQGKVRVFL